MIKALKLGNRAAEMIDAQRGALKVHSIFDHAINLIINEDYLLTLLDDPLRCSSQVIIISPSNLTNLIPFLKNTKDTIDILNLINFDEAEIVGLNLPDQIDYIDYDSIKKNTMICAEHMKKHGNLSWFSSSVTGRETIYSKCIERGLYAIESAYLNMYKDKLPEALERFVGLGPGLTPSGDDFICGFFSVLFYCTCFTGLDIDFVKYVGLKVIEHARDETTIVGYNMLRSYLNGELPEYMHNLMNCILTRNDGNLLDSLDKVLLIGSTSGSDMAAGVLFAFNMMDKKQCLKLKLGGIA